ncbi:hypothetical protein CPCC7001_1922 [Cyanobium sp. PCC 7001]|uniref:hypothetical protein n=1 Tax=Cyanobium sp. PCC 7001 TaxID=180281 RepID=UPI00018051B0|nr:hypothetical protein [Cyanobium sp. PCC 7001]EDY39043.1 hypothetical protein CPCC7001_1922 [Cyanobium sp. PCC 7001]
MDNLFGFKLMVRQPHDAAAMQGAAESVGLRSAVSAKFGTEPQTTACTMSSSVSAKVGGEPTGAQRR